MPPQAKPRRDLPQSAIFVGLTFGWAWLLWGYWVFAMPPGGLQLSPQFLVCALLGGLAPSLSAIAITLVLGGPQHLRQSARAMIGARPDGIALAVAILLAPTIALATTMLGSWLIGPLTWPPTAIVIAALVWPAMAALGEEYGWRGFLLDRLLKRHGLLPAALLVGVIWGVWHLPADYIALKGYGPWFWVAFALNGPIVLTAHSVIMAWLWRHTAGSLPMAMLYHLTITASAMLAPSPGTEGSASLIHAGIGAALTWLAAVTLLATRRREWAWHR